MLWVRNISSGYDLTDRITGLRWSNVRPGGDESASFTFHSSWFATNPEITKGDKLVIGDSLDVLWQGRIEEHARGEDGSETIAVTAYGLGQLLKDSTFAMVFADRDLDAFGEPSRARRVLLITANYSIHGTSVSTDPTAGLPAITQEIGNHIDGSLPVCETLYDAGPDCLIASVYYEVTAIGSGFRAFVEASSDDSTPGTESTSDLADGSAHTGTFTPVTPRRFVTLFFDNPVSTGWTADTAQPYTIYWGRIARFGNHGLTKRGSAPNEGFFASDIIPYVVGLVSGLAVRRIDATSVVLAQAAYKEQTVYEDAVSDVHASHVHERTYGTWGPSGIFDAPGIGNFDYVATDPATAHWSVDRSECESPDLNSNWGDAFNRVVVNYTDVDGVERYVVRTAVVPELGSLVKTAPPVSGGKLTTAAAQVLGDAILAFSGGFIPARGSVSLPVPVRHYTRGDLPAHYMRADGSNLQIRGILPSASLFELSSNPDRRTVFPMKRVSVDAGGPRIETTCELDQTNDWLSALQARLAAGADLVGA